MKITVTQQDIDSGLPLDRCYCPIYLALKRHIDLETFAVDSYGYRKAFIEHGSGYAKIYLPKQCADFMNDFDNDRPVKPFSFELDIPEIKSEPSGS